MFDILLQAYQEKIYSIKLKDVINFILSRPILILLLISYFLVVGVLWYTILETGNLWFFLLLLVFIVCWAAVVDRMARFPYIDRYKRKKEAISDLAEILQELDLYREQKIDLILKECVIWLNRGDKFTNITRPVVKYVTSICVPIIMFFFGLAANKMEKLDINIITLYAALAITVLIALGVFLWEASSILKPLINREYDAAKSLQMALTDVKIQRFWKQS